MKTLLCRIAQWPALRTLLWRTGRFIYHAARGESSNTMGTNGEFLVQDLVLKACRSRKIDLVALDIGANVGDWSRRLLQAAAEQSVSATVYGFEPVPETHQTLLANLEGAVREARFFPVPMAVSDEEGRVTMHVLEANAGRNSLYQPQSGEPTRAVDIACTTVSAFATNMGIGHIHLVKCDAEGHDPRVIRGALPLLASQAIEVLQFEYNHCWIDARHFLKDIFNDLSGLPYVLARVTPTGFEGFEAWHPELEKFIECNFLIIHRDILPSLGVRQGRFTSFNTFEPRD